MDLDAWISLLVPAARVAAVLWSQVLWRTAVGPLWWPLAAGLAITMAPVTGEGGAPAEVDDPWAALVLELLLGLVLGLVVALPGYALLGATAVAGRVTGLGATTDAGLRLVVTGLVVALGLGAGLHRPLLATLRDTFMWLPVGRPHEWWHGEDAWLQVAAAAHGATVLALAFASPVLLAAAVVETASMLFAGGPFPAATIADAIRGWVQAVLALVALAASWAAYPQAWLRAFP